MIYTTNILTIPLVIVLWTVDVYFFLLMVYGLLTRLSGERARQLRLALKPFIEPVPSLIRRRLERCATRSVKQWVPWAVVISAGLIVRYILVSLIVSVG